MRRPLRQCSCLQHCALLIALAARNGWYAHQMDVETAYLNGELGEDIYMRPPTRLCAGQQSLQTAQGPLWLKQGGRTWYIKIDKWLKDQGYVRIESDHGLYVRTKPAHIIIALYVDDVIILTKDEDALAEAKRALSSSFKMTDGGALESILGIAGGHGTRRTSRLRRVHTCTGSWSATRCKTATPWALPWPVGVAQNGDALGAEEAAQYQSNIGALLYAARYDQT